MTASTELNAGRIVGTFGLRGECKIDATRLGSDALAAGTTVGVRLADGSECELVVRSTRFHKGRPLVAFEGYADLTAAETLVGATLALDRANVLLAPGEYLDADLVGCRLIDPAGVDLGSVVAVEHYRASDMLVVGAARTLIPMVAAFVKAIDLGAQRITVDLPAGLLDDRDAEHG